MWAGALLLSVVAVSGLAEDAQQVSGVGAVQLTPTQQRILREAREAAVAASLRAEGELLQRFAEPGFRLGLATEGAGRLLALAPQALLEELRQNLVSLEYTDNFGLDDLSRQLHPEREAMDLDTVERYGHIPNDWELKRDRSRLVANVTLDQWRVYDAAETGLYPMAEFASLDHPTAAETQERAKYLAGNLRRLDSGVQRYGAFSAVVRNDVVRERAIFLPGDSGGWETMCNASVKPVVKVSFFEKWLIDCKAMFARGQGRPVLGVADHQMHTVLGNTELFGRVGGHLARALHQLLTPGAAVRPIEGNLYTEQSLFGPLRPTDLKLLVGNFPGLFGTAEGEALRAFCKRHSVPLAWGIGSGRPWPDEAALPLELLIFEPLRHWEAGRARLLDPAAGWPATNASAPGDAQGAWPAVWAEVAEARKRHPAKAPGKPAWEAWWARLEEATGSVPPLRAGDCASADLCFGTYLRPSGARDCVCRKAPAASGAAASILV